MRALVNPGVDRELVPEPSDDAARFHASLDGYEPTPLCELASLATELGVAAVRLKDESSRLGLPAFKILGASWAAERALREHPETHTLVAASAGNHGRAVANVASRLGLRARIFLPARASPARRERDSRRRERTWSSSTGRTRMPSHWQETTVLGRASSSSPTSAPRALPTG